MAVVLFTSFFATMTGEKSARIEAATLGELCRKVIAKYGHQMNVLLDAEGRLSRRVAILVDNKNAQALSGADTPLNEGSEVQILPLLTGG